ncbi:MAG TPA: hypothetical protein PLG47_03690 [Candidatus Dojkabacteria bacterium]|jgi:cytochrome b561|nr:hypothetical protein [Candidatus Dojkabacteria bacterium]
MLEQIPTNISLGLNFGSITAFLFFLSNFVVIFTLIHKVITPSIKWEWLDNLKNRWHNIHYFGNISAVILTIWHAVLMREYAHPLHWVLIALLVWMVIAGLIMRFSKVSTETKLKIKKFHAKWYMFVAVFLLLILAHLLSLPNFPYEVG